MPKFIDTTDEGNGIGYRYRDIKEYESETAHLADYDFVFQQIKVLLGRVLTVVDASFQDKEQRKAVKDIIKGHWSDAYCKLGELMFDQKKLEDAMAKDSFPIAVDVDDI